MVDRIRRGHKDGGREAYSNNAKTSCEAEQNTSIHLEHRESELRLPRYARASYYLKPVRACPFPPITPGDNTLLEGQAPPLGPSFH
jgi:hypothetical protein